MLSRSPWVTASLPDSGQDQLGAPRGGGRSLLSVQKGGGGGGDVLVIPDGSLRGQHNTQRLGSVSYNTFTLILLSLCFYRLLHTKHGQDPQPHTSVVPPRKGPPGENEH